MPRFVNWAVVCGAALAAACGSRALDDPIAGIPDRQQRAITRDDFGRDWPFVADRATIACDDDALAARIAGVTYALDDRARARGFAAIDSAVAWERSRPPANPLPTMKQHDRERVFRTAMECREQADAAACRARVLQTERIADADLRQIEAEGIERVWPPTPPRRQSIAAIVTAAESLCRRPR